MRRLDLTPEEEGRDARPGRHREREYDRGAQALVPDELVAHEDAETNDEGGDHRPTGTSGRNLTVEVFAHVECLAP